MNHCDEIRSRIAFYLDEELRESDLSAFESHIAGCQACRDAVEVERSFVESVRAARPLYTTPFKLRQQAEQILRSAPPPVLAPAELRRRVVRSFGQASSAFHPGSRRVAGLVAALVLIVVAAAAWYLGGDRRRVRFDPPSEFALMSVDTHLRHLRGQLPFEITNDSPDAISRWFKGKVSFSLQLPDYQKSSGQEKLYQLEGARLVGFKNDYAAYVFYQMSHHPISLVVTSERVAAPAGGEEVASNGLTFHCDTIDGLKVISWSDRGLTYALVSDLEERGQQSCIVCHAGTKDRDFIESLKPSQ
jgi:anti-sigma factor RsiW